MKRLLSTLLIMSFLVPNILFAASNAQEGADDELLAIIHKKESAITKLANTEKEIHAAIVELEKQLAVAENNHQYVRVGAGVGLAIGVAITAVSLNTLRKLALAKPTPPSLRTQSNNATAELFALMLEGLFKAADTTAHLAQTVTPSAGVVLGGSLAVGSTYILYFPSRRVAELKEAIANAKVELAKNITDREEQLNELRVMKSRLQAK